MKKLLTLTLLLAALQVNSQSTGEKKALYEKDIAKSKFYEDQNKAGIIKQPAEAAKTGSSSAFPPDADNDGMPDAWESANGLNQNNATDAWGDMDNDKVLNLFEYQLGSNPNSASSPTAVNVQAGGNAETAINNAASGQLVRVQAGTYVVNYQSFTTKTIMIQGGWNSSFTSRDPYSTPTIFDGQNTAAVLYFSYSSGTGNIVVDGIKIINGISGFGALGFINQGTSVSNLCIKDCQIMDCASSATFGGGIHSDHWGGTSEVFFIKTLIANNISSAIYNQTTSTSDVKWHIINCTFTNNNSPDIDEGYGIRGFTLSTAAINIDLTNSIIWGNELAAFSFDQNGGPVTFNVSHSDIDSLDFLGGVTYNMGTGVINANPMFINSASDYHLTSGSPCMNTGINVGLPYAGSAPEMGVYEFGLTSADNNIEEQPGINIYPNPVGEILDIRCPLTGNRKMEIVITDIFGKQVLRTESYQQEIKLNLRSFSSGSYFIRLQNEKGTWMRKFVKE